MYDKNCIFIQNLRNKEHDIKQKELQRIAQPELFLLSNICFFNLLVPLTTLPPLDSSLAVNIALEAAEATTEAMDTEPVVELR